MEAVAHSPAFASKVGIPQSVGKDFAAADKGKKFKGGGMMDKNDLMQDKKMVKKAVKMHDDQLHGGKKTNLTSLKKGGVAKMVTKEMEYDYKSGKKSFPGSTAKKDAHAEKEGKIVAKHLAYDKDMDSMCGGGKVKKMASGGKVSQLAKANGIAVRGKTKGTIC